MEPSSFLLSAGLLILVVMQFATAFIGWWLNRPLLPIVSTGILTGSVFGTIAYQALPPVFGAAISIILSVVIACTYCAIMDKAVSYTHLTLPTTPYV